MCFDFLSQGHSEGLAGSWVLPDLSCGSEGRAPLKSLGLLVRGLPGAQVPCPSTQQSDHKTDGHSSHYWLGFAIGTELLGERRLVGWLEATWYCSRTVGRMQGDICCHQSGCVAFFLHRCCSALGIPVPSSFGLALREAEIRQMLKEVTLLNTHQWTFTRKEKIWFSSSWPEFADFFPSSESEA